MEKPIFEDVREYGRADLAGTYKSTAGTQEPVEEERLRPLLDELEREGFFVIERLLLSQLQAIDILPGEAAQPLHYDDAFYRWPRPRRALGAAAIWAIDDFTAENGATVVIPRSHLWGERMPGPGDAACPVVMPQGSVLLFLGTLWHGGGENRSGRSRLCVTAQCCAPWVRQQENFSLSVSRERVKRCSEHIQRLLGCSIHPPFMGFVNGMHPKRLLE